MRSAPFAAVLRGASAALRPDQWNRYVFRAAWALDAPADAVYAALEDLPGYPDWWPQIRTATRTGDSAGTLVIRSALPYDLSMHLEQRRRDPVARVLVAQVTGDLAGVAGWTIAPAGASACTATFDERVEAQSPLLRRLAPLARPAVLANHAAMMRDGERGLQAWLGGGRAGGSTPVRPVP